MELAPAHVEAPLRGLVQEEAPLPAVTGWGAPVTSIHWMGPNTTPSNVTPGGDVFMWISDKLSFFGGGSVPDSIGFPSFFIL